MLTGTSAVLIDFINELIALVVTVLTAVVLVHVMIALPAVMVTPPVAMTNLAAAAPWLVITTGVVNALFGVAEVAVVDIDGTVRMIVLVLVKVSALVNGVEPAVTLTGEVTIALLPRPTLSPLITVGLLVVATDVMTTLGAVWGISIFMLGFGMDREDGWLVVDGILRLLGDADVWEADVLGSVFVTEGWLLTDATVATVAVAAAVEPSET